MQHIAPSQRAELAPVSPLQRHDLIQHNTHQGSEQKSTPLPFDAKGQVKGWMSGHTSKVKATRISGKFAGISGCKPP